MSKKMRRIAVLALCVVMFAAVQPACAGSAEGAITGAARGGGYGIFLGSIVGGLIGFCVGGPAGAAVGADAGMWICGVGGAVAGGADGYDMTPAQIEKAKDELDVMQNTVETLQDWGKK